MGYNIAMRGFKSELTAARRVEVAVGTVPKGRTINSSRLRELAEVGSETVSAHMPKLKCAPPTDTARLGRGMPSVVYTREFLAGRQCYESGCTLIDVCAMRLIALDPGNAHVLGLAPYLADNQITNDEI